MEVLLLKRVVVAELAAIAAFRVITSITSML